MAPPHPGTYRGLTDEEKAAAPKFTKELGLRILSYLRPYKLKFFIVIVVVLLSAALGVVPSLLTGRMVDDGLLAGNFEVLVQLIIASFLVTVVSNALGLFETWLNTSIAQGIIYDMKTEMYAHFQKQPYQYFVESRQGEIVTRMTGDVNGVQSAVSTTMTNSIKNVGTIIVSVVALFQCNWVLALTGMALVPFFILPTRVTGKRRWVIARESQEKYDEANTILGETLSESGILLVWLFGKQKKEYDRFKGVSSDLYRLNIKEMLAGRSFFMFMNIFTNFGPLLLYLVGGILMLRMEGGPQVTVGEITAAIAILGRIYRPVNELMNVSVDFTRSLALFERIFQTLDMVPSIVDKEGATAPDVIRGEIEYKDVSPVRPMHSSARPERASRHSFPLSRDCTMSSMAPSTWTAKTFGTGRSRNCGSTSASSPRTRSCSTTPSARTCSTRNPKRRMKNSWTPAAEPALRTSSKN